MIQAIGVAVTTTIKVAHTPTLREIKRVVTSRGFKYSVQILGLTAGATEPTCGESTPYHGAS
jgi:hypothetical protein